jgi:hypothetical protein
MVISPKQKLFLFEFFRIIECIPKISIKTITVWNRRFDFLISTYVFIRNRTSPKDEEQRHSSFQQTHESPTNIRDPFALEPHSKGQHHQSQSYAQQYHLSNSYSSPFNARSSRPTGSITQGSPLSPSLRLSNDQHQHPIATNNQLFIYHI